MLTGTCLNYSDRLNKYTNNTSYVVCAISSLKTLRKINRKGKEEKFFAAVIHFTTVAAHVIQRPKSYNQLCAQ